MTFTPEQKEKRRVYYKNKRDSIKGIILDPIDIVRFRSKLSRQENGCLVYTGFTHLGYGFFNLNSKMERAHRIAWIIAGNKITKEKPHVLHNCPGGDNRACCEITHLWAGNDADNHADRSRKCRSARGSKGFPFGVDKRGERYRSRAYIHGKHVSIGTFDSWAIASAVSFYYVNLRLEGLLE
jgi:hypothetical protein